MYLKSFIYLYVSNIGTNYLYSITYTGFLSSIFILDIVTLYDKIITKEI